MRPRAGCASLPRLRERDREGACNRTHLSELIPHPTLPRKRGRVQTEFAPRAESAPSEYFLSSLDHSVGASEQRRRQFETERLCRRQVDDELEYGGLLDRQIARLGTSQNAVDIGGAAPIDRLQARSIGHQAPLIRV